MPTHDEIVAELIRQIDEKVLRQIDVARRLGIAASRVAEIRNGGRRVQPEEMAPLAELLGLIDAAPSAAAGRAVRTSEIPILGKVAAGVWLEQSIIDPDDQKYIEYDRLPGDPDATDLFAVVPEGASMNLTLPPNVVLICRRVPFGLLDVSAGDLVIVEREAHDLREMTCKRLGVDENGDYLLQSESDRPEYQEPIRIQRSDEDAHVDNGVNIIGIVERGVLNFGRGRNGG